MNLSDITDVVILICLLGSWTYATHLISYTEGRASMARDYRESLPCNKKPGAP